MTGSSSLFQEWAITGGSIRVTIDTGAPLPAWTYTRLAPVLAELELLAADLDTETLPADPPDPPDAAGTGPTAGTP